MNPPLPNPWPKFREGDRVRITAGYNAKLRALFPDAITPTVHAILTQRGTVRSVSHKLLPAQVTVEWDGGKTGTIAETQLAHVDAVEWLSELA